MRIHLISYATPKYRHRQLLLTASALANGIVASAKSWTPPMLATSGFPQLAPDISLSERGSGFWAWKPFIIQQALRAIPENDIVFYCDVGRKYPYILLEHSLHSYVEWMDAHKQDIMPGVMIPWNGPMARWTKRDALIATGMDRPEVRAASPIQASFSFWRSNEHTRSFVNEWLSWCVQRPLISDDPSPSGNPEATEFRGHRHDQSLLTLCCLKHGIRGIDLGPNEPTFNERDPGKLAEILFSALPIPSFLGQCIHLAAKPMQFSEQRIRERITLGKNYE